MEKKHSGAHSGTHSAPHSSEKSETTPDKKWMYVSYALIAILLVSVVSNFFMISRLTDYVGPPKIKAQGGAGFVGKADAPVTLVMYTDYQCSYCARWYQQTYAALKENFIDTGLVRFEVKNFPLSFHPNAMISANAAECAEAQGSFIEYHEILYQNQGALDRASLIRYAGQVGIDTAKFTTCLDSDTFVEDINAEAAEGASLGVTGTPGFVMNGQNLPLGASPYSAFEAEINKALGK